LYKYKLKKKKSLRKWGAKASRTSPLVKITYGE
jgi:hypothetical protein